MLLPPMRLLRTSLVAMLQQSPMRKQAIYTTTAPLVATTNKGKKPVAMRRLHTTTVATPHLRLVQAACSNSRATIKTSCLLVPPSKAAPEVCSVSSWARPTSRNKATHNSSRATRSSRWAATVHHKDSMAVIRKQDMALRLVNTASLPWAMGNRLWGMDSHPWDTDSRMEAIRHKDTAGAVA